MAIFPTTTVSLRNMTTIIEMMRKGGKGEGWKLCGLTHLSQPPLAKEKPLPKPLSGLSCLT
jgi:hypothetical protein